MPPLSAITLAMRSLWLAAALCLCAGGASAQHRQDTLKEIKVRGRHWLSADDRLQVFSPGQKVKTIDSATLQRYQQNNMAALLAQQTSVFVKSYGFNALATLSFRGASAAQSQVYWNGVPIQNAALGIADVSTLPVSFMSRVNIVYGGSAALWGSGNVGGALLLETEEPVFDTQRKAIAVTGGAGSFGQYAGGLRGSIASSRWYASANVQAQTATNSFDYTIQAGATAQMPNGRLQSAAALLHSAYKINDSQRISLSVWYQQYVRQIPPALFEQWSGKEQTDGSLRTLADWRKKSGVNLWYIKSSVIRDEVRYTDEAVLLHSANTVWQYYGEAGWKRQMGKHGQALLFAPVQLSWLTGAAQRQQQKVALAGAYQASLLHARLNMALNLRAEAINDQRVALPGLSAAYTVVEWLQVRGNVQRSYRAPTLNELYYEPGGNEALLPEQGWSRDAGYTVKGAVGRLSLYHDLSVFDRNIRDWIVWLGGAVWTPHNIAEVHSRGVETENTLSYTAGKVRLHLGVNTAYCRSTTAQSYLPLDGSVGKQIPYAPRYNGMANVGATYKKTTINYNHTYTGYRFTTSDESAYLPPYNTGNIQVMHTIARGGYTCQLMAQCNNIWSQRYQIAAARPMPGINWLVGLQMSNK